MSPPQRKQNNSSTISPKSKKPGKSQRSTLQKQSATAVQNKTKKNETNQSGAVVETGQMSAGSSLLSHQDFVIRKILHDVTNSRNVDVDNVCQHICRNLLGAIQNKNYNSDNELKAAVDSLWDAVQQFGEYADEKLQMCEQFEMEFENDYHIMVSALHKTLESIGETQVQSKDVFDATIKQLEIHEKEIRYFDRKSQKTSTKIHHFSELRDNDCHQIANTNKLLDVICMSIENLRKSNNESNNQIDASNSQLNSENAVMSDMLTNTSQWLKEKTNVIAKMKQEKTDLKLEEQKLMSPPASDDIRYENVCAKVIDLTKEIERQAKLIIRINTAYNNLRDDHTEYAELKQMLADLSDELKNLTVDGALQNEADEKQRYIKQINEEISMKQQHRNEMKITLNDLENEIRKQVLVREYLYECDDNDFVAKRPRLSATSFSSIFSEINEIMNQDSDAESVDDLPKFDPNLLISENIIDSRSELSTFDRKSSVQLQ